MSFIAEAKRAMQAEADAIQVAAGKLGESFDGAVEVMSACRGKVVVTGIGKSGHVARKIASTLSSTGTSGFFLHPSEAMHGDFGMLAQGDVLLAIAFGGETREVVAVAKHAKASKIPVIAITGKLKSTLAQIADYVIDGSVEREACPLGLAPTVSSTLALAIGDGLAVALMKKIGFSEEDFARLHPEGTLGKRLSLVSDYVHPLEEIPSVSPKADFDSVIDALTRPQNFGIVSVLEDGKLLGCITDGDLRRLFKDKGSSALEIKACEFMSKNPKIIEEDNQAIDAITRMNEKGITQLFVSASGKSDVIGIIRLHDLLAAKVV